MSAIQFTKELCVQMDATISGTQNLDLDPFLTPWRGHLLVKAWDLEDPNTLTKICSPKLHEGF